MRLPVLIAVLPGMLGIVPAAAQPAPLIPDWPQTRLEQRDRTTHALYIMAACAVYRQPAIVETLLATRPGSPEETQALANPYWGRSECFIGTDRIVIRRTAIFRGAMAEAVYNGRRIRPRSEAALPPTAAAFEPDGSDRSVDVARWVARCTVQKSRRGAHAVVSWGAGSPRERQALLGLRDTFIGCLPAGERVTVSRLMIRALIAEELYQAARRFRSAFTNA